METTKEILKQLIDALKEQYGAEIDKLPIKPKDRGALKDGFADGVRSGVFKTCEMLGVKVNE